MAVHAVVDGPPEAPALLLAGSLGSTVECWTPQVPALASRFRVVRYDTRGHGRSPAPPGPYTLDDLVDDALALLDRLGVTRAHIAGLSLGGLTAARLAARAPKRVHRLALACTSPRFEPASSWAERAAVVRAEGTAAVAGAVVRRWLAPGHRAADPALVARLEAMVAATPAEVYAACCDAIRVADVGPDLPTVAAPTLVLAGADDPAAPPDRSARIAAAVPDARLAVLPDCAHLATHDQPDAVTAALMTHLDSA